MANGESDFIVDESGVVSLLATAEEIIVMLSLIGPAFGLIDWVMRGEWHRNFFGLIGWLVLLLSPGFLFPTSIWIVYVPAVIIAGIVFVFAFPRMKNQTQSESTLLFFCNNRSVAMAGSLAACVMALFFFSVGLLGHYEDFFEGRYWLLFAVPPIMGALLSLAKRWFRAKYPQPTAISFAPQGGGGGGAGPQVTGGQPTTKPGGLMRDELVMAALLTPILWPLLSSVFSVWNLFFLFGMVFLPGLFIYVAWSALQRSFLRWIGKVNRQAQKQFEAYERLVLHEQLSQWAGELTITFDDVNDTFIVMGTLPERHLALTLRQLLHEIGNEVDSEHLVIDQSIAPNPWFQSALSRRDTRKRNVAG